MYSIIDYVLTYAGVHTVLHLVIFQITIWTASREQRRSTRQNEETANVVQLRN